MRKIVFLWIALIAVSMNAFADGKVSFTASAPDAVAVGDQFRLSYTVTTQKVRDFRAPSMKGFDVLMGPSRSQQSSVQMINGQTTSTSSITFTYILMATAEGDFTISGATITADGLATVSVPKQGYSAFHHLSDYCVTTPYRLLPPLHNPSENER